MTDKLESLSTKEKHILCDCLFLAINWFREVCVCFGWELSLNVSLVIKAEFGAAFYFYEDSSINNVWHLVIGDEPRIEMAGRQCVVEIAALQREASNRSC